MPSENVMSIGVFSKSCRLTIKALRLYDENGLLKPAYIDPQTGYRYYRASQARDAVMIGMLRSLGMPLTSIAAMLKVEGEAFQETLERERQRITSELTQRRQALASVEQIAGAGSLAPYEIGIRTEPPHTVAKRSIVTQPERMVAESGDLIYALFDELAHSGVRPGSPVMCINEDPRPTDEQIVVHGCVGVTPPHPALVNANIADIEGGPVAWLTHRGSYDALGLAYHALFAWTQERGHPQRASVREIYLNDPAEVSVSELVTEVLLPI